jgi:dihydroflavonol-4-reductase
VIAAMAISVVTGGGGFVGRHLLRALLERGEHVRVLDLRPRSVLGSRLEWIEGSCTDRDLVRRVLDGAETVYHLAAIPHLWAERTADFRAVNVAGTETVVAAAETARPRRFVHCSSAVVLRRLARTAAGAPIVVDPVARSGPYGRSKWLAHQAVLRAAERGLAATVVGPTLPIGAGDVSLTPPTRMLLDFLDGRNRAFVDFEMNLVWVGDVARALMLAAERGRPGMTYVAAGEALRLREILEWLESATGLPMPKRTVPYPLALAFAAVSEFLADHVTRRTPAATVAGVRLARLPAAVVTDAGVADARTALGLVVRPVRDALAEAVQWLAARNLIGRGRQWSRLPGTQTTHREYP